MSEQIDLQNLIEKSTSKTFKKKLEAIINKNVPIIDRLSLYNYIAKDLYSNGHRVYGVNAWDLGVNYIEVQGIDNIEKAEFIKTYGLAWMDLNQFDLAIDYLNKALEYLDREDNEVLIDIYFGLSVTYKHLGDLSEAMSYSLKATDIARKLDDSFELSRAYLNAGNLFLEDNQYDRAQENYEDALKYAATDEIKSNILMSYGLLCKNRFEYKKAEKIFRQAEELFTKLEYTHEIFELYVNYGILYVKLADFDKAYKYLKSALGYFKEIEDSYNITTCYLNIGRLEQDRSNFSSSKKHFDKAIELAINDENLVSMRSLIFYSRANLLLSWREYDTALDDYQEAMAYAKKQNDRAMEASIKNALAGIAMERGNFDQAKKIYQEILETFKESNNIEEIVGTYSNIGLLYDEMGMFELSKKAHVEALKIARTAKITQLEVAVLINMAELFATILDIDKAIETYNEALEILSLYDNDDLLSKCYLNLANIYESTTDFKTSIKYGELALSLKNKLKQDKSLYIIYNSLAASYDGLKETKKAEAYYKKSLAYAKKNNISNYYGVLVNYGLFLFNLKNDIDGALDCYEKSKKYFEKEKRSESLIAINSNYAMLYQATAEPQKAIIHYKKSLDYAQIFISFIEDENLMMKYRVNFMHIYDNLIKLNLSQKNNSEAIYYLEELKSRTFSKILSSKYFESDEIPHELLEKEKNLQKELNLRLNGDSDITKLNDDVQKIHEKIKEVRLDMKYYDEEYISIKENVALTYLGIKKLL